MRGAQRLVAPGLTPLRPMPNSPRSLGTCDVSSPETVAPGWVDQCVALNALPGTYDSMEAERERMDVSVLHPEGIKARTIVFHGAEDLFVPAPVGEDLHERIKSSELMMVPHGDHMLPVTRAEMLGEKIAALAGCAK